LSFLRKFLGSSLKANVDAAPSRSSTGQPANVEPRVQPPNNIDEAVRLLFEKFRDGTYYFKEKSGLEWEHLVPGLQAAAVAHFIRDRGKARTIEFLQKQMRDLEPVLEEVLLRTFAFRHPTPLDTTNMAAFNSAILRMADGYVTEAEVPLHLTAHALSLLVIVITTTQFDPIRTMASIATSVEEIEQGRFDKYEQR
jgi:hypothetical protein